MRTASPVCIVFGGSGARRTCSLPRRSPRAARGSASPSTTHEADRRSAARRSRSTSPTSPAIERTLDAFHAELGAHRRVRQLRRRRHDGAARSADGASRDGRRRRARVGRDDRRQREERVLRRPPPRRALMRGNGGGNIVLLGSIDGVKPAPSPVHYAASKAALSGMVKAMAKELGPYNIRVNTIAPGVLDGGLSRVLPDDLRARVPEALRPEAARPARRGGQRRGLARAREHPGHRADDRRGRCAVSRRGARPSPACSATRCTPSVHLWRGRAVRPAVGLSSRGAAGRRPDCCSQRATLNAVGLLWSCFGLPIWLLYSFTGGEFMPTAALTHIGALVLGIYGVRDPRHGRAARAWKAARRVPRAVGGDASCSRRRARTSISPFACTRAGSSRFPSYPLYFATLLLARRRHVRDLANSSSG